MYTGNYIKWHRSLWTDRRFKEKMSGIKFISRTGIFINVEEQVKNRKINIENHTTMSIWDEGREWWRLYYYYIMMVFNNYIFTFTLTRVWKFLTATLCMFLLLLLCCQICIKITVIWFYTQHKSLDNTIYNIYFHIFHKSKGIHDDYWESGKRFNN